MSVELVERLKHNADDFVIEPDIKLGKRFRVHYKDNFIGYAVNADVAIANKTNTSITDGLYKARVTEENLTGSFNRYNGMVLYTPDNKSWFLDSDAQYYLGLKEYHFKLNGDIIFIAIFVVLIMTSLWYRDTVQNKPQCIESVK